MEQALEEGLISGAGFDVNPARAAAGRRPADAPGQAPQRHRHPHVAWASDEAQQVLADQLIDNIENFVAGKPSNLVKGAY